jgi:hypothetical protein
MDIPVEKRLTSLIVGPQKGLAGRAEALMLRVIRRLRNELYWNLRYNRSECCVDGIHLPVPP